MLLEVTDALFEVTNALFEVPLEVAGLRYLCCFRFEEVPQVLYKDLFVQCDVEP